MRAWLAMMAPLALCAIAGPANALQSFTGKVTSIEATYMPSVIPFRLDQGNAACPAGTPLLWQSSNIENNKAIYATLLSAHLSGQRIMFYMNDNDASCTGRFIYVTK